MHYLLRAPVALLLAGALLAGCAADVSRYRDDSAVALALLRSSGAEDVFPVQFKDFLQTHAEAEVLYTAGEMEQADQLYSFAISKAIMLEKAYTDEVKRREDQARRDAELKRQAEIELQLRLQKEKELAEAAARAAAEARKLEAEKAEARRRSERLKAEKEQALVSRHTVKRGETLPQIAALPEVYGDSSLWPLIYKANRDQIKDPKVLWPGQNLKIPRNLDKNDVGDARRFSQERQAR